MSGMGGGAGRLSAIFVLHLAISLALSLLHAQAL